MVPGFYLDGGVTIEHHIHARSEFDQAHALAARDRVANFEIKYDAAGDQSGDLLENHGAAFAFHGDDVLLVFLSRVALPWR